MCLKSSILGSAMLILKLSNAKNRPLIPRMQCMLMTELVGLHCLWKLYNFFIILKTDLMEMNYYQYNWAWITRYFIPVKIENSTCDIFLLLSALSSCVVCVFEPKYKSAAAAYVLLFLRNVTCASLAPYNIYTTWEERRERKMTRWANPPK